MVSMDPAIERGAARVVAAGRRRESAPLRVRLPISGIGAVRALIVPLLILAMWQLAVNREFYSRGQLPAPLDVIAAGRELQGYRTPRPERAGQRGAGEHRLGSRRGCHHPWARGRVLAAGGEPAGSDAQCAAGSTSLAWVPLFVLWLGIGETPKLTLIALGAFFPVYTNLVSDYARSTAS